MMRHRRLLAVVCMVGLRTAAADEAFAPPVKPERAAPPNLQLQIAPLPPDSEQAANEPVPAPAGAPGTTLDDVVYLAQTINPALREASAKVGVAQGQAIQVGMWPNPSFFTSSPQWAGSVSQYNVVFVQDFITAGKLRLDRAAASRAVEQAQLDFTRTRYELLTNVRRQFYMTACAQRRAEVLEDLLNVAARSRDVGKKLLAAGETNRADATQLEIEYDKAVFAQGNAEALLRSARKQLAAIVGAPESDFGPLQFDLDLPLPEYDLEAVRQGVVDQNAVAAAAAVEIQKMQIQLRRARVEPVPNFQLQGGYQYSTGEIPSLRDQGYAQFMMSLPIWNRNQGGIRAARADTARAMAALQRTENELSATTAEALGLYLAAEQRATIYREQILPKAREVFRINRSLFEQGQTDFLRLLQSQRTLIEADLGYIDAQEARWTAAATIAGLLQMERFP